MNPDSLLHYVSLDGAGGVEQQFVEFAAAARARGVRAQAVVACGRRVHPLVRARLQASGATLAFEKYVGRLKLPKWPPALRAARQRALVARHRPATVLIWNRLRDSLDTLAAAGAARTIYWERGASWFAGDSAAKREFLARVPAILCNSVAAQRMLELRWHYQGQTRVIHNALRPSLRPEHDVAPRDLDDGRDVTLGLVARLEPIKGAILAVHALAIMRAQGWPARLCIAGDGPEMPRLQHTAARLGVAEHVDCPGLVADMPGFYRRIDLLVHPALREPFGQIAVEAGAYGLPAVVAAVDGLVEVVADGVTGRCVAPTLALADYRALGGGGDDLPPWVYDPARDVIDAPKAVAPQALAAAVVDCLDDRQRYRDMSAAAIDRVRQRFDFDAHVNDALASIAGFVHRGRLDPGTRA